MTSPSDRAHPDRITRAEPSEGATSTGRRGFLASSAALLGASALGGPVLAQSAATSPARDKPPRPRALRLAHMTDSHIQPERGAAEGMAACLAHMNTLADKPQLLVTGGDLIMDGFEQPRERTALQWDLYTKALRDGCGIPVRHTLGNHDVWGWNQKKSLTTSAETQWGKRWALDALALDKPYSASEHGPWRLVTLDSVFPHRGDGYIGKLDEEQFAWLDATLADAASKRQHVAIVSHIPILSVTVFDLDAEVRDEEWRMSGGVMHVDAQAIFKLFKTHGCVRLAISGHIHKLDRCEYQGVTYICDGAVSGTWWRGPGNRCPEGYGVFDLYDDGTFAHEYQPYGWTARES